MHTSKDTPAQCWPAWPATVSASAALSPLSMLTEILPGVEAAQENCEDPC